MLSGCVSEAVYTPSLSSFVSVYTPSFSSFVSTFPFPIGSSLFSSRFSLSSDPLLLFLWTSFVLTPLFYWQISFNSAIIALITPPPSLFVIRPRMLFYLYFLCVLYFWSPFCIPFIGYPTTGLSYEINYLLHPSQVFIYLFIFGI